MSSTSFERLNNALIICILFIGYGLLFVGAFYSAPNAEDFSLSAAPYHQGIVKSTIDLLVNYDGRYATNILHGLSPLAFGYYQQYYLIISFGIVFAFSSLYFFLSALLNSKFKLSLFLYTSLFMLLAFALNASIVHWVYWLVSSFVYLYSICFLLIWLGAFFKLKNTSNNKVKLIYYAIAVFFLLAALGINEMFLVINIMCLLALFIFLKSTKSTDINYFYGLLIVGFASVVFFLSSPGIGQRYTNQINIYESFSVLSLVVKSSKDFFSELWRLASQGGILVLFVIALLSNLELNQSFKNLSPKKIVIIALVFLVIIYASSFAFYLPMGHEKLLPVRIFSSLNFLMLVGMILLFIPLRIVLKTDQAANKPHMAAIQFLGLLLLGMSLFFSNNNLSLIKAELLDGTLAKHQEEMQTRYEIISETLSSSTNDCWHIATLPKLSAKPISIFHLPDIEPNRTHPYWNAAYEKYFQVNEIRLEEDTIFIIDIIQGNR